MFIRKSIKMIGSTPIIQINQRDQGSKVQHQNIHAAKVAFTYTF